MIDIKSSHSTQPNLTCSSRSFISLVIAQFFGAYNDNLFKTVVSLLVLHKLVGEDGGIIYLSLTAALFFLPYILFSAIAGWLSDAYSKSSVLRWMKALECFVMALGLLAFHFDSPAGLLLCVFLMGMQSALFSPAKLGILPEMLKLSELSRANGYLEFTAFAAIILGTAMAGLASSGNMGSPGVICISVAVLGWIASHGIVQVPAVRSGRPLPYDPIGTNVKNLRELKANNPLWLAVLGIAFFWSVGALFQLNILVFAKQTLLLSEMETSLLLAVLGFGIGIGSIYAGRVSEGKVELGLIPIGSFGLALFPLLIGLFGGLSTTLTFISIFLLGMSSGLFIVPLNAYLQEHSPMNRRGEFIAASNFLSNAGMLGVSFLFWLITGPLQLSSDILFVLMGGSAIFVAIYLVRLLPETLTRCVNWIILHIFYSLTKRGLEHIPEKGGALLVCNHITYIDAMLLLAALPRPVRFIMYRPIYNSFPIHPIARLMKAIPISSKDGREALEATLQRCGDLIDEGEIVGIFAEGGLSRTGEMQPFKTGLETIMRGRTAPIIPAHLAGLWGSIFSHSEGKVFWKLPKRIPYPVTITFGEPLPANATAQEVEQAVKQLAGD